MPDMLQRILVAAARHVSGRPTCKFDRGLSYPMHNDLHWLDIT